MSQTQGMLKCRIHREGLARAPGEGGAMPSSFGRSCEGCGKNNAAKNCGNVQCGNCCRGGCGCGRHGPRAMGVSSSASAPTVRPPAPAPSPAGEFQCDQCRMRFISASCLSLHVFNAHPPAPAPVPAGFPCRQCHKRPPSPVGSCCNVATLI